MCIKRYDHAQRHVTVQGMPPVTVQKLKGWKQTQCNFGSSSLLRTVVVAGDAENWWHGSAGILALDGLSLVIIHTSGCGSHTHDRHTPQGVCLSVQHNAQQQQQQQDPLQAVGHCTLWQAVA